MQILKLFVDYIEAKIAIKTSSVEIERLAGEKAVALRLRAVFL